MQMGQQSRSMGLALCVHGMIQLSALNHHVVLGPLAQLDHLREPGVAVQRPRRRRHGRGRGRRVIVIGGGGGGAVRGCRRDERRLALHEPVSDVLVLRERPEAKAVLGTVTEWEGSLNFCSLVSERLQ